MVHSPLAQPRPLADGRPAAKGVLAPVASVLVIKLGALGDFFMALPALRALRAHHADARLTLLTIESLRALGISSGLFDEVLVDPRGRWPLGHWRIARLIRERGFARVYDLQGNRRTAWYYRLLGSGKPSWAGPVRGCALPRPPRPPGAHRSEWYAAQLTALGIPLPEPEEPRWLAEEEALAGIPRPFCLVAAGGSSHRPDKRWPVASWVTFLTALPAHAGTPLLVGTEMDAAINRAIAAAVPRALDLTAHTSLGALASLAREARGAVGNDTGPMHVMAATGCPCLVLYSSASDPDFIRPLGASVHCLRRPRLEDLPATMVLAESGRIWRSP